MNDNDSQTQSYPCNECQAGMLRLTYVTYFTWLDDELVTVPNFPAWVCDVCGRREYDERAISWLATLLNPETGRPTRRPPRPHPPMAKRDSSHSLTK
ncbi:MAG: YgiT-type zinc finger protein [Anaerolineales bacterium]